ncbi:hypothetical protein LZ30DRAFT_695629 [Colletotrichum cereale]|nr:hypothetical protein LZ30DRAFT_695629 [Colletotrichum cereale]
MLSVRSVPSPSIHFTCRTFVLSRRKPGLSSLTFLRLFPMVHGQSRVETCAQLRASLPSQRTIDCRQQALWITSPPPPRRVHSNDSSLPAVSPPN